MATQIMHNYLELAMPPVCNYDFHLLKNETEFQAMVANSTLYIIGQRSEFFINLLEFEGLAEDDLNVIFEIRQKGNNSVLKCKMPIYQNNFAKEIGVDIKFYMDYILGNPKPMSNTLPQSNIRQIIFTYADGRCFGWLSAERFLQHYLNGIWQAQVEGSVNDFLIYRVHYVGKATEQEVWKRLTGHSTLQQILSLEYPFHYESLPTHEMAILFLKHRDSINLHTIDNEDAITDKMIDSLLSRNLPDPKTITLDAEKALISAMQPKYNKEFYRNYPRSKNGLYPYNLDAFTFRILSPLILQYGDNEIVCMPDTQHADSIVIEKNKPLKIYKANGL